jgi:hypothetical protein
MIACYRLSDQSASFEFFLWLVLVKAKGAKEIVIDTADAKVSKMDIADVCRRLDNILVPGAALAGLPVRCGSFTNGMLTARAADLLEWTRNGKSFDRLKTVIPPGSARYTITLRRHDKAQCRNSNEVAWRQFADEIGAAVIEDYSVAPISLHDRTALYAGAKMNFGVCNGPLAMIYLSEYPATIFVPNQSSRNSLAKLGIAPGGKLPWMLPNQKMVWKDDSYQHLALG